MKCAKKNLQDQIFGNLTVIEEIKERYGGKVYWRCRCVCGKEKIIRGGSLLSGKSNSCGCNQRIKKVTHGHSKYKKASSEYMAWKNMKTRCYNIRSKNFKDYGGRGIIVCNRWLYSFETFLADMGRKPSMRYSLDRFPNNETGIYEPSNCRWATRQEQAQNRRPRY